MASKKELKRQQEREEQRYSETFLKRVSEARTVKDAFNVAERDMLAAATLLPTAPSTIFLKKLESGLKAGIFRCGPSQP